MGGEGFDTVSGWAHQTNHGAGLAGWAALASRLHCKRQRYNGRSIWGVVMARTPGDGLSGKDWGQVALQSVSGLIVGVVVIYADGGRQDNIKSAERIGEMAVQIAEMNKTLLMVCDQVEEKNKQLGQIQKDYMDLKDRVTRLEARR